MPDLVTDSKALHARIVTAIDTSPAEGAIAALLQAIAELHQPYESHIVSTSTIDGDWEERSIETDTGTVYLDPASVICHGQKIPDEWPCRTIRALAAAFQVDMP